MVLYSAPGVTGTRAGKTFLRRSLLAHSGLGVLEGNGLKGLPVRGNRPERKGVLCACRDLCVLFLWLFKCPLWDTRRNREVALLTFQRWECPWVLLEGHVTSQSCRDTELTWVLHSTKQNEKKRVTFRDRWFFRCQPELSVKESYWNYYWNLFGEKERNWRKPMPHGGIHSYFIGLYSNHSRFHSDIHLWHSSCLSNNNEIVACSFHCRNEAINLAAHQSSQQSTASVKMNHGMKVSFQDRGMDWYLKEVKNWHSSIKLVNAFKYNY